MSAATSGSGVQGGTTDRRPTGVPGSSGMAMDGAALGASALLTAVAGLVGWLIAARTQPQDAVGAASAFVNSFMLVAALSELGLGPGLLRWLPRAGGRTLGLLRRAYPCVVVAAVVFGVIWHFFVTDTIATATRPLSLVGATALFVLAALGWTLFHLQDEVLTGTGLAKVVPIENVVFSAARLVLLLVLGPSLGALGIVLSWVIPTVAGVLVVSVLLARRSSRLVGQPGSVPTRAEVVGLIGPVYPAAVGVAVMYNVVPLIVVARYGAADGAAFFIVWMGLNALDLAATGYGNALVIRLVASPQGSGGGSAALVRQAGRRIAAVALPALAVAFVLAGVLLGWFGPGYRSAAEAMMRWVLVGFLARATVLLITAVHLGAGRSVRMAVLQTLNAVGLVVIVGVLPTDSLAPIGLAFAGWQLLMMVGAAFDLRRASRRAGRS